MKLINSSYLVRAFIAALLLSSCGSNHSSAPASAASDAKGDTTDAFRKQLSAYISARTVNVGVAIMCFETNDTVSVKGHDRYAMMSVCKFPQAITLLHLIDQGTLARTVSVHVTQADFRQSTHSSLQKDHPHTPFNLTVPEAFAYSIGQSDNVTSNIIFALEGGPPAVEAYIRSLGIDEIGVATDYWHMRNDSLYKNWITPVAAIRLLYKFYTQKILSESSQSTLWSAMVNASSGRDRLPGQLPASAIIGHKTGTSGRDSANVITAFNDIGIMQLPNGRHIAVAVFIANSLLPDDQNAKIISDIGKMAWDYYARQ